MKKRLLILIILIASINGLVHADPIQNVPDAGEINSTVRDLRLIPPVKSVPNVVVEQPPKPETIKEDIKITVSQFRITGASPYSADQLKVIFQGLVGKELSLAELNGAAAALTQFMRNDGYLVATAVIPAQEIKNGSVEILVIMGKYGAFDVRNHSRIFPDHVKRMIDSLKKEEFIRQDRLERVLLMIGDLAGIRTTANLKPGAVPGTSDLILDIYDTSAVSGSVGVDNYGSRFLGKTRTSVNVAMRNLTGTGDDFSFSEVFAGNGLNDMRAVYQMPVGPSGFKVGASYGRTYYLLGDDYAALNAYGSAQITSGFITYPLKRSYRSNLYARIGFDSKQLEDRQDSTNMVTNKQAQLWSVGLSGDHRDKAGDGVTSFALTLYGGNLTIDGADAKIVDDTYTHTAGGFNKTTLAANRVKWLNPRLQYTLSLLAQSASKNLNSSEKMSLGGAYGVRAYPQGEASGDEGLLFTGELKWSMPNPNFQLIAFLDAGGVTINKNPWDSAINQRALYGAGVGVAWSLPRDFAVRLDYAWKLGSDVAVSDTDRNGRVWLQGVKYF